MFTGLVQDKARVAAVERNGGGVRLTVETSVDPIEPGDSVSVNGVCLTVVDVDERRFDADVMDETLRRTTLGDQQPGDRVNLEPALRASDRLGGHIVQGHVDGTGVVDSVTSEGLARLVRIGAPPELLRYVVEKGSIAVDGISLTVVEDRADGFTVAVIPHTAEVTTLGIRRPGDRVNLEVDLMAKYAEKLLAPRSEP